MNRRYIWVLSIAILVMMPGCITEKKSDKELGVGDHAPRLYGEVWDGNKWSYFNLENDYDHAEKDSEYGTWYMINFIDTNCGYCQNEAQDDLPQMQQKWTGENPTRTMPEGTSVQFIAVAVTLNEDKEGWEYGKEEIKDFRAEYEHDFLYMDDLDNSNRDRWGGIPGTPTKFLIGPDGEIHYSTNDNEQGDTVWDTMEELIPYE
jgi:hypothetical protein